jgi:hypothetical protein
VQARAASGPVGGERLRSRTASRVAMAGNCGVLLVLTSFALWAASRTNQAALHAAELTHLNDAYQQARLAVTAEELLEHKYSLEPNPDVRVRFERAAQSLDAAVAFLLRHGDEADRQPVRTLTAHHRRYVQAVCPGGAAEVRRRRRRRPAPGGGH